MNGTNPGEAYWTSHRRIATDSKIVLAFAFSGGQFRFLTRSSASETHTNEHCGRHCSGIEAMAESSAVDVEHFEDVQNSIHGKVEFVGPENDIEVLFASFYAIENPVE